MRFVSVILASLLAFGCGTGKDPQGQFKGSAIFAPSITALVPNSTPVNSVPFFMTVNGANFTPDAIVVWNGTQLSTTFVSSNQLVAALAATDLQFMGEIKV